MDEMMERKKLYDFLNEKIEKADEVEINSQNTNMLKTYREKIPKSKNYSINKFIVLYNSYYKQNNYIPFLFILIYVRDNYFGCYNSCLMNSRVLLSYNSHLDSFRNIRG